MRMSKKKVDLFAVMILLLIGLGTVMKLLVTSTPYKCSAAKKKIAGIAGYVKIF